MEKTWLQQLTTHTLSLSGRIFSSAKESSQGKETATATASLCILFYLLLNSVTHHQAKSCESLRFARELALCLIGSDDAESFRLWSEIRAVSPPVDEDKSLVASDESCPAADNNLIHARIKNNKNNSVSLGFDQVPVQTRTKWLPLIVGQRFSKKDRKKAAGHFWRFSLSEKNQKGFSRLSYWL